MVYSLEDIKTDLKNYQKNSFIQSTLYVRIIGILKSIWEKIQMKSFT